MTPAARYREVREATVRLAAPLAPEDQAVQSMPDASPTKWHLAHTTWFFEAMVLAPFDRAWRPVDERYAYLFNSYYEAVGPRPPRPSRGLITRPTLDEVHAYRRAVDGGMERLLAAGPPAEALARAELGLHHEQQHQELILTDAHHALWSSPLQPAYAEAARPPAAEAAPPGWIRRGEGMVEVGHDGPGFAFDNERPRHRVFLESHELADRPVTAGEFLRFIEDGGYRRPELWLSDGWSAVQSGGWRAPMYWERRGGGEWRAFTLAGWRPVDPHAPVSHVSHFEADAYARWAGARLPTEFEWEQAAPGRKSGEVWEWTASAYLPYPRFRPLEGALGEYNGKFMSGQMVLRGGSRLTPPSHVRPTYRNFFPPATRWQMSGFRLARWA
jgi:ergothioneine biosynthesis protein EgtB